jgi:RsiW-degrading membrane proteinase PrsW (M82 family)
MTELVALTAACLGGIVPTLVFVFIAYAMDRYEREPLWLASMVFLWGAIPAIIISLIIELGVDIPLSVAFEAGTLDLVSGAVVAPVVEEIAKAIPLFVIFYWFRKEFDGLMDGLLYGSLVGFGFSMTENILYFLGAYAEGGFTDMAVLIFLRSFVFGLNHALFTSALGVGLGFARYSRNGLVRTVAPILGLGGAILLHAIHNFFVSVPNEGLLCLVSLLADYTGIIFWLILVFFALRQERKWITDELRGEVESGLLPAEHAKAAASYSDRMRDRARIARERGSKHSRALEKLHFIASDLAFKKRQLAIHGEESGNTAEVTRLRGEVTRLLTEI